MITVGVVSLHVSKGLEDLLYDYGVDLEIWAHEHSYERLWPIYNYQVYNGSLDSPYSNPEAPVHVVTGSAGCSEFHDPFKSEQPYWSAFRSNEYGYNRLKVVQQHPSLHGVRLRRTPWNKSKEFITEYISIVNPEEKLKGSNQQTIQSELNKLTRMPTDVGVVVDSFWLIKETHGPLF
ncbi:unnamed protein product [Timema podura]|uniref:Purple acid phosphatase C-terminal domain-containing protein n=1 Tax=Timema podura TaxID=61482 RepID=A0ABN7NYW0_TIMPD|nr:unnamed protein product [Timema podura]